MDTEPRTNNKHRRGFASMSIERRREIASLGGKKCHLLGTAHKWTPEQAQEAGRKGGIKSRRRPRQQAS